MTTRQEAFVYGLLSGVIHKDEFKNLKIEDFDLQEGLRISHGSKQFQVLISELPEEEDVPLRMI